MQSNPLLLSHHADAVPTTFPCISALSTIQRNVFEQLHCPGSALSGALCVGTLKHHNNIDVTSGSKRNTLHGSVVM